MLKRLQEWYNVKEVIGISCTLDAGKPTFNLCHLQRQGDSVDVIFQKSYADQTELFGYLEGKKSLPISLHMQGRGILVKQLAGVEAVTSEHILAVFPNYSEETYVYGYMAGTDGGWLALMRKELLEEILQSFWNMELNVVRVFIGPSVVENVLGQLNGYSGDYLFDGHHIRRDNSTQQWQSYRYEMGLKASFAIKIQGMDIAEQSVMPYAAAFSILLHRFVPNLHVDIPAVDDRFADMLQKLRFKNNGILMLAVLFVLLMINSLLYVHYQARYDELAYRSRENFSNANELERLSTSVSLNDTLLRQLGWNGGVQKSWIINQLAKSLEGRQGIDWQEVAINPHAVSRFGGVVSESDNRYKISIMGICQTLGELERWVRTLGQMPWVEQVEISRFVDQNKPNAVGKDFMVTLLYTYDF